MDKTQHTDNKHRIIKGFFQTHPPAPLTFERGRPLAWDWLMSAAKSGE